jgi:hypothetical protein
MPTIIETNRLAHRPGRPTEHICSLAHAHQTSTRRGIQNEEKMISCSPFAPTVRSVSDSRRYRLPAKTTVELRKQWWAILGSNQ